MSAFTPGPWMVNELRSLDPDGDEDFVVRAIHGRNLGGGVEVAIVTTGSYTDAVEAANARLIAQAPELYEALAHILWIKDCGIDSSAGNDSAAERDAMYDIARAAIAEVDKP